MTRLKQEIACVVQEKGSHWGRVNRQREPLKERKRAGNAMRSL
ncbi:MAG: hypothetical protein ABIG39_01620 [Candidatus Micrarchaeota archaeon]